MTKKIEKRVVIFGQTSLTNKVVRHTECVQVDGIVYAIPSAVARFMKETKDELLCLRKHKRYVDQQEQEKKKT